MAEERDLLPEQQDRFTFRAEPESGPPTGELSLVQLTSRTHERANEHRRMTRRLVALTIITGVVGVLALARVEHLDVVSFVLLIIAGLLALLVQRALKKHRKSQQDLVRAKTQLQRMADTDSLSTVEDQLHGRGSY